MSANSFEEVTNPTTLQEPTVRTLGSAAILNQATSELTPQTSLLLALPREAYEALSGTRKTTMTISLIKEKYQSLSGRLTADEREVRRAAFREESVRILFKTTGMLPNDDEVTAPFSDLYRGVVDRSRLADLAEIYETHPVIQVLDILRATSAISKADIVTMMCVSLLLIEQTRLA